MILKIEKRYVIVDQNGEFFAAYLTKEDAKVALALVLKYSPAKYQVVAKQS